jgi:hypothetical protein
VDKPGACYFSFLSRGFQEASQAVSHYVDNFSTAFYRRGEAVDKREKAVDKIGIIFVGRPQQDVSVDKLSTSAVNNSKGLSATFLPRG